jgi:prepilin-type N-terminal cleavage/methylation domain-containing protein
MGHGRRLCPSPRVQLLAHVQSRFVRAITQSGAREVRGFTLLEVLLSLAIIALLGGVLIGGGAHLLSEKPVTTHEVFWQAVQETRKAALKAEHEMRLKFDKEKKQFVVLDGLAPSRLAADGFTREEVPLKQFPVPNAGGADFEISFLSAGKGGATILLGGLLVESQPISHVTFYSDGTCSPFRLQLMRGGSVSTLSIDPWTCAPVLPPTDPNGAPTQ